LQNKKVKKLHANSNRQQ